ncbi:MAG: hypothetical protein QME60_03120 [Verrucomicrobiota bacterium]|nr:hypothetical protein [Verrucomicrobiota bacterium]
MANSWKVWRRNFGQFHGQCVQHCLPLRSITGAPAADFHGEAREGNPDIGHDEFVDRDNDRLALALERFLGMRSSFLRRSGRQS